MSESLLESGSWLPYAFAFLIGLSMLLYAILDGYDLGVGMLSRWVGPEERDRMIASIGPFWDANETWLVLGVGLLLVAFPVAHGEILGVLYLPVALMIVALIFRGVAFDFRKKSAMRFRPLWDRVFWVSSLLVALTQGYMVGRFVMGFQPGPVFQLFAGTFGLLVVSGYVLMGSTWLILKTEGELQRRAILWAKWAIWVMVLGAILSSLAAVFSDTRLYDRMLAFPEMTLLLVMPVVSVGLTLILHFLCGVMPLPDDRLAWMPFAIAILIFVLGFTGLVYSFYPYIIPGQLRIVDAAAAPESLIVIFVGAVFVLPFLIGYTLVAYHVFRGKARDLRYD